jgi:spermidine dehydrogenase
MSNINRRDFINGSAAAIAGSLAGGLPTLTEAAEPSPYPPGLTGLRGSHPGSNTTAHQRAWSSEFRVADARQTDEHYDLVVVGAGLSGLAAAVFFRQQHGPDKKILILDNHDDFGGHARRNEHNIDGKTLITYGGSQTLVEPRIADPAIRKLFEDIGVDLYRFDTAFDRGFYGRHNLSATTYFNEKHFGQDTLVHHPFCNYYNYVEGLPGAAVTDERAVAATPLSDRGKQQLLRVLQGGVHSLQVPEAELNDYLDSHNYFDYLTQTLGVDDTDVLRMARHSGIDWSNAGTELLSIAEARECGALGFAPVASYDEDHPYIHHFPDGNAGVARTLVNYLIPSVALGNNAEALVKARFDYSQLDRAEHATRLRLNSTVVDVRHNGNVASADQVRVRYVAEGSTFEVSANNVIMACYNVMIPHIVTDLPEVQAEALSQQMKSPLIYTTIGLRNWRAFKEQGLGLAMCPGNMHQTLFVDFPVSLGGYQYTQSPDDPCVIQMISCPYSEELGKPRSEQYKEARYRMLGRQFSDYEAEIREHLSGMLSSQYFDFDREVASVTVNRWAHGYTVAGPGDSVKIGRQPFGRIAIANSDSAPNADAIAALEMGYRAVHELVT